MKNLLLCSLLMLTPAVYADWLDQLVADVAVNGYDKSRCLAIVKSHTDKDKQEIDIVETHEKDDKESGIVPAIRSGARKAELLNARASLSYHQRVEAFVKQLAENKKDRETFEENCKIIQEHQKKLEVLQKQFVKETNFTKKAKIGAHIATKKAHVVAKRTLIKASVL